MPSRYFAIHLVDSATGRGVPLVELRTTSEVRYVTDSAGWIAFDEPDLMGRRIWFTVKSHGYEYPADGFGFRGIVLTPTPGGAATIKMRRINLAERLYRVTGAGMYRDSVLLGKPTPLRQPLLNARVAGQDSVMMTRYRGTLRWFWGDTNRTEYPLGHFGTAGAVCPSDIRPERGIDLTYFTDASGFSRPMLPVSEPGPVWIGGLAVVENGTKLVCTYARMKDLGTCLERGLAVYDDRRDRFVRAARFDPARPAPLSGHPFLAESGGRTFLFGSREGFDPLPCVRVAPTVAALSDPGAYEVFGREDGVWGWRRGGTPTREPLALRDIATGKPVDTHAGSVFWNAYRRRWVMIVQQKGGDTSFIGEIWFAEADTPAGPWAFARKIVTHDRYDFYNPTQHPLFDEAGGRRIYFEGTYVNTFSGNPETTPRYNYNQVMYRLDLTDPRLALPAPVYRLRDGGHVLAENLSGPARLAEIAFFALPPARRSPGTVPVWETPAGWRTTPSAPGAPPLFYALPAARSAPDTEPLPGVSARIWMHPFRGLPFDFAIRPRLL